MKSSIFVCLFVLCTLAVVNATTSRDDALITSLPGLDVMPSYKMYSGYVTVNEERGSNMFYWFIEAKNDPANAPTVVWTNGGPGCSSMAGLLQENGPFYTRVIDAGKQEVGLRYSSFTWNDNANMVYIDHPIGVGFSYTDSLADRHSTDNKTAIYVTRFLEGFFQVYSEYAKNPLWITGESYGGVYIPTTAYNILTNSSDPQLVSSLKNGGLMLGNPVTECGGSEYVGKGDVKSLDTQLSNFYWHGMVSPSLYTEWKNIGCNTDSPKSVTTCQELYLKAYTSLGTFHQPLRNRQNQRDLQVRSPTAIAEVNPDCLYYSYCVGNATLRFTELSGNDCFNVDSQISAYLNRADVQQAIHAQPTHWRICGGVQYSSNVDGIMPYIESFFTLAPNMRILYYAGDIDIATVPFPQTFRCLMTLNRPVVEEWRPYVINNEIGGYVEVYDTYTLATVKGAGHEAPAYQPAIAYVMFNSFLKNETFPAN